MSSLQRKFSVINAKPQYMLENLGPTDMGCIQPKNSLQINQWPVLQRQKNHIVAFGYTNKMSWSRWPLWSTEAGGLVVYCFYCVYPFLREGTILLAIWGRRHHFIWYIWNEIGGVFFIYVQNHAGGWPEFHFIVVVQIKLFYWYGLNVEYII